MGKRKSIQACNNILTETDLQNAAKMQSAYAARLKNELKSNQTDVNLMETSQMRPWLLKPKAM
jgi:hypothetical protein